jgi:hypothetical protein
VTSDHESSEKKAGSGPYTVQVVRRRRARPDRNVISLDGSSVTGVESLLPTHHLPISLQINGTGTNLERYSKQVPHDETRSTAAAT